MATQFLHWLFLVTDQVPPFLEWQLLLHLSYSTEWPALISDMEGTYILWPWQNGSALTSDHGRNQSSHHVRIALSSRLSITRNWPGASIQRIAFRSYIWSCENTTHSHLRMAQHSHMTMEGTNPLTKIEWLIPYIWPWKEPILSPCHNGSWTHHFPLEGTSILRTPSFSLKYSNFTLAISRIESHQGWFHSRITCEIDYDRLHPRTTYRTVYVWETYELRQDFMLR